MNTISRFSPKTIREIQEGKRDSNGRKKVDAKEVWSIIQAREQKQREQIFGKAGKLPKVSFYKYALKDQRRKAIEEADRWFSKFIRLRDSDEHGIATCVTSGKRAHWTTMDCGHYVSRAKQAVRYDEMNCHAQSKMSNRYQGGHFVEHGNRIDELHGIGTAEKLRQKGLQRCSRTTSDYLFLADCYRQKVEQIKTNDPGKFKKA